jgi:hypothetical protein
MMSSRLIGTLHFDPVASSRTFRWANRAKRCGWITWGIVAGLAGTLTLGVANSPYAKSNRATAVLLTKAPTSVPPRHAEPEVRRRSTRAVTTEVPAATELSSETTAAASPATRQLPGTRPLAGPIVSLTRERLIEFEELLGANTGELSVDDLANKVLLQGEAVTPPAGRADDFARPRPDIVAARSDPVVATSEPPKRPVSITRQSRGLY